MDCATSGCHEPVPPSKGKKPRGYCPACSTPAARKARARRPVLRCCKDYREQSGGYKCPQHQVGGGHRKGDQHIWWMSEKEIAGWLHQQSQVWFPPLDPYFDAVDERSRAAATRRLPGGSPGWHTDPGAQAAGTKLPVTVRRPTKDELREWNQKLAAEELRLSTWTGYVRPSLEDDDRTAPPMASAEDVALKQMGCQVCSLCLYLDERLAA
jgi:hypothetical protein